MKDILFMIVEIPWSEMRGLGLPLDSCYQYISTNHLDRIRNRLSAEGSGDSDGGGSDGVCGDAGGLIISRVDAPSLWRLPPRPLRVIWWAADSVLWWAADSVLSSSRVHILCDSMCWQHETCPSNSLMSLMCTFMRGWHERFLRFLAPTGSNLKMAWANFKSLLAKVWVPFTLPRISWASSSASGPVLQFTPPSSQSKSSDLTSSRRVILSCNECLFPEQMSLSAALKHVRWPARQIY